MGAGALLVFDGDCAFCTSSVRWLERRFPSGFATVPYQHADLGPLGLSARECHARLQWIGDVSRPSATRAEGARAVAALLREGGRSSGGLRGRAWRTAAGLMDSPPVRPVAARVYRWVADHRDRLPGGTPACAMPRAS